ncbi:hypothetical protein [Microbacterium album]|uniref:Uncharacterized protein n=1 Tax=Microbacterium album TaxID=2053191 RepID=A0A917IEP7_9MICO|nr:hypothetical protein [Microbacterium album]GGH38999.1 hypothetical protein GCM10010921_09980 [Microbacterium album]
MARDDRGAERLAAAVTVAAVLVAGYFAVGAGVGTMGMTVQRPDAEFSRFVEALADVPGVEAAEGDRWSEGLILGELRTSARVTIKAEESAVERLRVAACEAGYREDVDWRVTVETERGSAAVVYAYDDPCPQIGREAVAAARQLDAIAVGCTIQYEQRADVGFLLIDSGDCPGPDDRAERFRRGISLLRGAPDVAASARAPEGTDVTVWSDALTITASPGERGPIGDLLDRLAARGVVIFEVDDPGRRVHIGVLRDTDEERVRSLVSGSELRFSGYDLTVSRLGDPVAG